MPWHDTTKVCEKSFCLLAISASSPNSCRTNSSRSTALYLERPFCESDYTLAGPTDELLSIEQLALWLELRSTSIEEILRFGLERYIPLEIEGWCLQLQALPHMPRGYCSSIRSRKGI